MLKYYYMTMNILDSDWTKHYFTLYFKMWSSPIKSAHEVNITFEHCSVYSKIVFENVFSDWSIFKEAVCYPISVFLSTVCITSSCFMSIPRCFPFRDILFVLNFIHLPVVNFKSQVNKRIALKYYLGEPHFCFCFCDDYYSGKKNITNFGFIHIIKQLMTLDFS